MIEVAVGVARRGREELDKAFDHLDGDLETKLAQMVATGLALVGDDGRRLLSFLPLFPAGNFMPEAMQAACAAAERAGVEETPTPTSRPSLWGHFVSFLGRHLRMTSPAENENKRDEESAESAADASARVFEGIRQLERGGFLDLDQRMNLYTFHQTLRDYAERGTDLSSERSLAAFFGLLSFYRNDTRDDSENYEALDRCLANELAGMELVWEARQRPNRLDEALAGMVDDLGYIFDCRSLWQLGDRWNERAIALRRGSSFAQDVNALSHELYRRACLLQNRGQYGEAKPLFADSLQLEEKAGNLRGQAVSLHKLAIIESAQGSPDEARRLLQRCMVIMEGLDNLQGQATSLHQLAIIESGLGNYAEARLLLQRSGGIYEDLGDLRSRATALHQLAIIESEQGNRAGARLLLQRSLAISEGLGELQGRPAVLHVLATIESAEGNYPEARRLLRQSLGILERLGDQQGQSTSLHELARIELAQHNPAEARRLWERSLMLYNQIGAVEGRATALLELAQLDEVEGNLKTALAMARESLGVFEGIRSAKTATARTVLARLESSALGRTAQSPPFLAELSMLLAQAKAAGQNGLSAIDATVDEARREGVPAREVVALLARSIVCWNAGEVIGCDESLRRVSEVLDGVAQPERAELGAMVDQAKAQRATATEPSKSELLHFQAIAKAQAGDMAEALRLFEASLATSRMDGEARRVAINLLMSGQALLALGRADEARDRLREGLDPASALGDENLFEAMQKAITAAAEMVENSPSDTAARKSDR
jgi:tetratricopeptide (TPR) repeat protein